METSEMRNIIESVNTKWPKDYIIRYLYVKLAPFFQKDLEYFLLSDEEKFVEYSNGFVNRGRNIVCSTLADYYVELFQSFGIKAVKIAANSAKIPLFAVVVEGDYGWFFIDPLNDLFNNQYRLKTTEFGVIPRYETLKRKCPYLTALDSSYVDNIDKELELDDTLDDYFEELHIKMTNRHFIRNHFLVENDEKEKIFQCKMEFSNDKLINLGKVSGPFERIRLYLFLEKKIFFKTEKKNLKIWLNREYDVPRPSIEYTNHLTNNSVRYEEVKDNKQFVLKRI